MIYSILTIGIFLGLRKVKPYFFEYRAYAKGRWMKRKILNVFKEEFQDRDEKYYVSNRKQRVWVRETHCMASSVMPLKQG